MKTRKILASCMILVGVSAGGWAGNELFVSDIRADSSNELLVDEVEQQILNPVTTGNTSEHSARDGRGQLTAKKSAKTPDSRAYAVLNAEKLGKLPIVQGELNDYDANQSLINEGLVVRYQSTNEISENPGNTALIGHRLTHGSVFKHVPDMKLGEKLTLTTSDGVFEYEVVSESRRTLATDNSPLYEPLGVGVDTEDRTLLTLITCGNWLTDHREVVVLELSTAKR
ncbi:sortase domain-containing protein [Glutamicibacter ardleyensis]|uniref:sortase domain-containing protein n=1 Tax=Glutamicibacter ardleyensis TaxID=225894 RepID=UPI003FD15B12